MRLIQVILLIITLNNCRHYFVRDAAKYNLTQEEENILKSKKIGIVGFHPFYMSKFNGCCGEQSPSLLSKDLLRALQFIYEKNDSEPIPSDPDYFVTTIMMRDKIEQSLSDADTSKIYFSFGQKMEKSKTTKPDTSISEKNLRQFLKTYLDETKHLGYKDIIELLDFSDKNKVFLQKNDFDYWVIGFHSPRDYEPNIKALLTYFTFTCSFGLIPLWSEDKVKSSFWIFDKKINLIKKIEMENKYDYIAASWLYWKWKNEWKEMQSDPPVKVYEPDLKEFQKELVKIMKNKVE